MGDVTTINRQSSEVLSCVLTDAEMLDRGRQLAESLQDIREEEDRQATAKKEMKDTLESLQKEADRLSAIVRDGREDRTVAVRIDHDEARLMVHKTRLDTGELIASRAMTEEERQRALPFSRKVN